jgi:hypothetical protein
MKRLISVVFFGLMILLMSTATALAGDTILWRGWMDLGSCNRIKWYTDSFGIRWPTNESVGQTLTGEIYLARTVDEVAKNHLTSCAAKAVVTAGATAILSSGSGAWPAFLGSFNTCLTSEGLAQFIGDNISIRYDTHCNW